MFGGFQRHRRSTTSLRRGAGQADGNLDASSCDAGGVRSSSIQWDANISGSQQRLASRTISSIRRRDRRDDIRTRPLYVVQGFAENVFVT